MKQTFRITFIILLSLLATVGLYTVLKPWLVKSSNTTVQAHIVRDRVEKVMKLVVVEAQYSEIYDYQHFTLADVWPLRKKALVKVQAKVQMGYDFENFNLEIDSLARKVIISDTLTPKILSIEHDLDFYSFENGWFSMINNKDITEMGRKAKDEIRKAAENSDLYLRAEEQKKDLFELLELSLNAVGWTLERRVPQLLMD